MLSGFKTSFVQFSHGVSIGLVQKFVVLDGFKSNNSNQ